MSSPIRLLLADDHAMLRQGTAELLRREPDLEVVGEASDGAQAIELARQLKPDIVVMDVRMPVLSGVEATRRIRGGGIFRTMNHYKAKTKLSTMMRRLHDERQGIASKKGAPFRRKVLFPMTICLEKK